MHLRTFPAVVAAVLLAVIRCLLLYDRAEPIGDAEDDRVFCVYLLTWVALYLAHLSYRVSRVLFCSRSLPFSHTLRESFFTNPALGEWKT